MSNRLTRFPGLENKAEKAHNRADVRITETLKPAGLPRINHNVSHYLRIATKVQSPWTEYRQHLRTKQAGDIIIAYDRKMKEFAIKEVKECERDWLLRLKAVSHTNIVRFFASFFHEGSIYLVCDLMSTSLANVLSVSTLPLDEVATVCRGVITGLCYLHKDLMISHGDINSENILFSKSGEVKLANVGERLLEQPREHNPQEDVWSLGLLLIEMLEPDSIFLEPFPTILQRPDSTEPCTVNFLSRTRFDRSSQLQQHEFLQKSRGGQYLKPFISDAERFMPPVVEKLDIS